MPLLSFWTRIFGLFDANEQRRRLENQWLTEEFLISKKKQSIFTQNATLVCCGCPTKCRPCQIFFDSWKLCWSYWTDFVPNWWNEEQKNELFQWLIYVSLHLQWLWPTISLHQWWGFQTVRIFLQKTNFIQHF